MKSRDHDICGQLGAHHRDFTDQCIDVSLDRAQTARALGAASTEPAQSFAERNVDIDGNVAALWYRCKPFSLMSGADALFEMIGRRIACVPGNPCVKESVLPKGVDLFHDGVYTRPVANDFDTDQFNAESEDRRDQMR